MISVVVAAYNRASYLEQAIRSVQAQTCQDFEVVIVDDGSTDNTRALAEQMARADPRIRVISQANSGGPAQPRNLGIARSTGEYVCFLDPDDYWYPDKLERQLEVMLTRPDIDMVFCDLNRVDQNGANLGSTYLGRVRYMETAIRHLERIGSDTYITRPSFLAYSSVGVVGPTTCSVMVRRRRLDELSQWFPVDLLVGEDIDLWFRILETSKAAFIDVPLYAYRQHPSSLMHNDQRVNEGLVATHTRNYARVCEMLSLPQKARYRRHIAAHLFDLAYQHHMRGAVSDARRTYLRALTWSPRFKVVLALCKSFVPGYSAARGEAGHD